MLTPLLSLSLGKFSLVRDGGSGTLLHPLYFDHAVRIKTQGILLFFFNACGFLEQITITLTSVFTVSFATLVKKNLQIVRYCYVYLYIILTL
jgi:hypothetical protein